MMTSTMMMTTHWTPLLLCALAGVAAWTLAEYLLHRLLGHHPRTRPNAFADEHTRHHAEGGYFAPTWKKALVAVAVVPLASAAAALVLRDAALGLAFGCSFTAMYVAYEVVHRRAHTHAGRGAYGRFLRRHHFHHHFENPRANHGVTSPLWDMVFGTYETPTLIRVPRKLAMRWLADDVTNEIRADLAGRYAFRE